jgi:lysophospholipase
LRTALFAPAEAARGSVVLSAGRTEPIEKYGEVIGELVGRGFVVLAHDWAGQGLSGRFQADPLLGDSDGGWRSFVDDLADVVTAHAEALPRPWLLLGHSMGGALSALALANGEHRFEGAALCSPMIEFSVGKLPFWLVRRVVAAAGLLGRGADVARQQVDPAEVPFEVNVLTHDRGRYERTRALYRAHPELRLGEPTWRWLTFAIALRDELERAGTAERISCPLGVVIAGDDRIVNSEAIRRFVARVPRGSAVEVAGAFHEILMETDQRRAMFWEAFDRLALGVSGPRR